MLLLMHIFGTVGIDRIPPVTIITVAIQIIIYLRLIQLPWYSPSDICMSFDYVWNRKEWQRFLFGAFEHADDFHLYYNMVSFIWKGQQLERKVGKFKFLHILCVFTLLTNATLLALNYAAGEYLDSHYRYHCAVGFSGVIFALKVLNNYYWPQMVNYVYGIPFPASYVVWLELIIIQLLTPNASFMGHLAGIIVGLLYVKGPLKPLMDTLESIVKKILMPVHNDYYSAWRNQYHYSYPTAPPPNWYENYYSRDDDSHLTTEEIRRRRLFRFNYTPTTRN